MNINSFLKEIKKIVKNVSSIFIIADSNLPKSYIDEIENCHSDEKRVLTFSIQGGEHVKTLQMAEKVYQELIEFGADRQTLLICLGGGTISDLGSYVASTFKRGIDVVLLPTSLLAMVDASIGGKTGVNIKTSQGYLKNQIGTFYTPKAVLFNTAWLNSLPKRELRAGWAEMVKHALLQGDDIYLDRVINLNFNNIEELEELIHKSAKFKQKIVDADPLEKGERAQLNLGHTIAHALETLADPGELRHGEAVAWGLGFSLEVSQTKLGYVSKILNGVKGIVQLPNAIKMWEVMQVDKKNKNGNVVDVIIGEKGANFCFIWTESEFIKLWEDFRNKHL
tara:strand:- start:169 stop:1179 length:1011 start_codon:yes stop_codon:yes gene_type:complete